MEFAFWAYPWDILDEDPRFVADRLVDAGITELNLATNYHSVQAFTPHNPERRTFFAQASSYFQPGDHYETLQPVVNETMGDDDWIETIADELRDVDIALNSWTVGVHNSRLGLNHPEATIENAFGDSLAFGLCPSKPMVQAYLTNVVEDLAGRDIFSAIELEMFDYFYGSGFGWHHDKFHTELGTLGEFLFGLCFCSECQANAESAGVNSDLAKTTTQQTVDGITGGTVPHDADMAAWLKSHPTVAAYADVRFKTLSRLYEDIATAAGSANLGYYVGLVSVGQTWMQGADLHALSEFVDYYTVAAYEATRADAVNCVREADQLTPEIPLHAGVLPGYPIVDDASTLDNIVSGLIEEGVPRISFYNYGLLPEQNIEWVTEAIRPYR
ncbi:hypothetical protein [Haladaptatus sp. DYSN1]|uniref:hypothetical protein n=1 Tax=unclassified Haladaptatus TaxID=2622732 RepID=UPI002405E3F1|nr:hypothetical protein [Haladaptatus sp. DYSN1]